MIKRFGMFVLLAVLSAVVVACASVAKAPKTASGRDIAMYVIIDRGIEKSYTDYQVRNRNQVGEWMERDLTGLLGKAGYNVHLIGRRSEYKQAAGAYLLTVKITNYNPGSKAARMMVGYGVGATSMQTRYELFAKGQKSILADDLGVGSGSDWTAVVRKIDVLTVNAVTAKLSESAQ